MLVIEFLSKKGSRMDLNIKYRITNPYTISFYACFLFNTAIKYRKNNEI